MTNLIKEVGALNIRKSGFTPTLGQIGVATFKLDLLNILPSLIPGLPT
jgi:folate-dependent phosphoribosylglycinamide formyltransferase PurN